MAAFSCSAWFGDAQCVNRQNPKKVERWMDAAPTDALAAEISGRKECRVTKNNTATTAPASNSKTQALHRRTQTSGAAA